MGYKHTAPSCYIVSWDDDRIVKVGYSHCQRWRKFALRGARVLRVIAFDSSTEAFAAETTLDRYLRDRLPAAFGSSAESIPYMGSDGGGWAECFRFDADSTAVDECVRIADALTSRTALGLCTHELVRTGLTEMVSPLVDPATNASRAGGQDDFLDSAPTPVSA